MKQANSGGLARYLRIAVPILAIGAGPAWAANSAPNAAPANPSFLAGPQQYDECLGLAHSDPQRAYDTASVWRDGGGGFPAEHCEAVALIGLKKYPEAAAMLESMAGAMMQASADMRGDTLDQAGQAWLLANKPNEAKSDFDGALAFEPKNVEVLIDRAEAQALGGKYFDAIDDLNRVLDIDPKRADALIYRASAYRQLDSLDLALDDVERALQLAPDAPAGLLERGNIRRLKGDLAGAQADWQQIVKAEPNSAEAQAARDNIAHLGAAPSAKDLITGGATPPGTAR